MGIIITPKEKIDEYFESDALNQSSLKKLIGGIEFFINQSDEEKKMFYEEKGHFIIGSAVDTILTGEDGQFEKSYYVSALDKKPSDTEMSMINMVFKDVMDMYAIDSPEGTPSILALSQYPGSIFKAIEEHAWQANWKMETKINKIVENGSLYFEDLKKGIGKQILTVSEKKLIDDIVFSLRSNARTARYFNRHALAAAPSITVYYQLPIFFYYKDVYCKALLDLLIVTRDAEGTILSIEPIDLKTMSGSTLRFHTNMKSFRYDIQAAWYTEAILSENSTLDLLGASRYHLNLAMQPFKFVVESNNYPGQPLVYEIDEEVLHIGKYGKKDLKVKVPGNQYEELVKSGIKGFDELIDIFKYQNENEWVEEEVIAKSNGVLKLGWNGIKD